MIKLTTFHSNLGKAPTLVLIPGGPGLSSRSIRGFDLLKRSFNLVYIDFPGTNLNPYEGKKSFEDLSSALVDVVKQIDGDVYLVGHSYGGFFAADVGLKTQIAGIICVATPFSKKSLNGASSNYTNKKQSALAQAEKNWSDSPTDTTFANWLSEYAELYFSQHTLESGMLLMSSDPVSSKFYLDNRSDTSRLESIQVKLKGKAISKLFIAGANDGLLNLNDLKEDAANGDFDFQQVNNANHFVMLDQPESVASLIESFIATKRGS